MESYMERYSRQIRVIGEENQRKLMKSSVLVVGAGGLGSAVIAYLAGAGIGKLGIADGDIVEVSNLDRQIIHAGNIGMNKAESAKKFVEKLNPGIEVLTFGNFPFDFSGFDVVVSCLDSFKARYALNDACLRKKIPLVHAAVSGFEGELMVFDFKGPCYRCVYPEAKEIECPVVSPVAGIVGCMQALETIKLICGYDVTRDLLRMDFKAMEFIRIKVSRRKNCICSVSD